LAFILKIFIYKNKEKLSKRGWIIHTSILYP